jgi:hypothetical protein
MKHCNRAHVWGVLQKCEEKTTDDSGAPYLEIRIDCQHDEHGSVQVLGFVWGRNNFETFRKMYKVGAEVRVSGGVQQYVFRKTNAVKTSFNLYSFKDGPLKERKATFILVGEVVSLVGEILKILVSIPASKKYAAKKDEFVVSVPNSILLMADKTPEKGQTVSVKGYIVQKEDEYGETVGSQRPVVKELFIKE